MGRPYRRRVMASRTRVVGRQRGYLRVGGYYGRYRYGNRAIGLGTEQKFWDSGISATIASGQVQNTLNDVAQGTGQSQRVGRSIMVTAVQCRGHLELPTAANPDEGSDRVRVMLVLDKQANGAAAAITDVLQSATTYSFNNLSNVNRFRVLYDKILTLNSGGSAGGGLQTSSVQHQFTIYQRCRVPIQYNGPGGTLPDIQSNNFLMIFLSDSGLTGVQSVTRIRYIDA